MRGRLRLVSWKFYLTGTFRINSPFLKRSRWPRTRESELRTRKKYVAGSDCAKNNFSNSIATNYKTSQVVSTVKQRRTPLFRTERIHDQKQQSAGSAGVRLHGQGNGDRFAAERSRYALNAV